MATPLVLAFFMVVIAVMAVDHPPTSAPSLVTYIFGDSLAEVGNNNYLQYSLARSDFPYYGIDYTDAKPTGRFTNGRTIGDILSEKLGSTSPPPYLSLNPHDDAIMKGVNYASGGAGILNDTGLYFIQRMTFDDQIDYFENTTKVIKAKIGEQAGTRLLNEAVYFIGMGSNDYINNYLQPFLLDSQQYTPEEFLGLLNLKLAEQFTRLYLLGARKIVFHGLGPLGCIPSQRAKSKTHQCLRHVNEWVLQFNTKVQKLMNLLNLKLKNAQLTFADTYNDVLDMVDNPSKYGFKVSNTSCCKVDTTIGGLCLSNANVCKNRREYVFWDAFHPTDAANAVLADRFFSKMFTTPNSSKAIAPNHNG
ncbi:SGNH hydrolase-type esterase superfamily protein [Artemisia annua]|uniref:SGNH hydrolase-type esterase superfamily protein n=1 Tax=Artemisia annua TaxID=35608 RepID=A0A2U1M2U9_ARTAN|nr:SGNH hydrolase-type esterase superfamily protein [Artemisia annua]